ncbi:MAG TPA: valine--tRNA ligase [Planctomycetes bacterium]|nr:valine--tRNA ligase [Planctomycetota bacterium]
MAKELASTYDPQRIESPVYRRWLESGAFDANPDDRDSRYVIMMPLPNVTGALHMGHALDNVMQDLLSRWHRMMGDNTLWMPGTDHAGIATQAVVEKRLFEVEGKTRHDVGREGLVEQIWGWKDQYQKRIILQQQAMGCSCDWKRQRFTMDEVCARAVTWTFFKMFDDGLIYQGNRMVNWDCHLQTAISDDEIEHRPVDGHFWHLRYPVIDPQPGEPEAVVVATTRPETMLGDTAVACHPDPSGALEARITDAKQRLERAPAKNRDDIEEEIGRLEDRRQSHLPLLEKLAKMSRDGRKIQLPIVDREIPLITDEWARPELGSGCVKITPGHDSNDYEVWTRHSLEIEVINILEPDGTLNDNAGPCSGLDRFEARKEVVRRFEVAGLLDEIEDRKIEVGHSARSQTPIEPYLSLQWFVDMGDVDGGVICGRGTDLEFNTSGLAQVAIDAASGWKSATGRTLSFHPDPERYKKTLVNWLAEKRDWCISRQLWWGHQIPIWSADLDGKGLTRLLERLLATERDDVRVRFVNGAQSLPLTCPDDAPGEGGRVLVCLREPAAQEKDSALLEDCGLERDPDVLDTWFSSALWPHSTLGWPDPATATGEEGQSPFLVEGSDCLSYYYPGSCLVTGRDIITLWVARMVVMGLYNVGDLPFTDVFLHAIILDGKGERMSKSKGNGIDPVDIIERYGTDAMRYVLCEMQTGTQDIRLPVQAISPFTGNTIDLSNAKHGRSVFTYICPDTEKEFDILGSMEDIPSAKLVSDRFEVGRNFCNKLWNAVRFAMMNLDGHDLDVDRYDRLNPEDRWILSRLSAAISEIDGHLGNYNPSAAIGCARELFWSELCDWYLEVIKPRLHGNDPEDAATARQVLAVAIDHVLRLLHPFVPFITEELWAKLAQLAPVRGIDCELPVEEMVCLSRWPEARQQWRDEGLEQAFATVQDVVRGVREIRARYQLSPRDPLELRVRAKGTVVDALESMEDLVLHIGGLSSIDVGPAVERTPDSAAVVVEDFEIFVPGVVDLQQEKARLETQAQKIEKLIEGSQRKLENENFVTRAKPEVVEKERQQVSDLEGQLAMLQQNISALGEQ